MNCRQTCCSRCVPRFRVAHFFPPPHNRASLVGHRRAIIVTVRTSRKRSYIKKSRTNWCCYIKKNITNWCCIRFFRTNWCYIKKNRTKWLCYIRKSRTKWCSQWITGIYWNNKWEEKKKKKLFVLNKILDKSLVSLIYYFPQSLFSCQCTFRPVASSFFW